MIGIVGCGFVGSAVRDAFIHTGVKVVDPKYSTHTLDDLRDCEAVFICLPTPSKADGSVDASLVIETLDELDDQLIIVKSTLTPDYLQRSQRIVYNPEFLTQRTAKSDFINPDSLIFGGVYEDCLAAVDLYWRCSIVRKCPVFITDIHTACLVKYTLNCHFAAKVTFLNEIYQLHQKIAGSTWNEFTEILGYDSRLGPTHLQVPGPDGFFGFGGACFPKDTKALIYFADSLGIDLSVLKQAVIKNELIRNEP